MALRWVGGTIAFGSVVRNPQTSIETSPSLILRTEVQCVERPANASRGRSCEIAKHTGTFLPSTVSYSLNDVNGTRQRLATGEIGHQISGIQSATQSSVSAISAISGTIERLSEIASTIAAAVEEQGAATQEISRNVQNAAQGAQQVSANIVEVQRGATETGTASSQVLTAAQSLSTDSNRLKLEVGRFLDTVRAA